MFHVPVLLNESIEGLAIQSDGLYVDATFGGGGHSKMILEKLNKGKLFAFDQDEEAAKNMKPDERLIFIQQNFRYLKKMLKLHEANQVDGILADLGISSHQVDSLHRGFAHRFEGKLDMRMDGAAEKTAADILNTYDTPSLQKMLSNYGEVRNAKTLSERITEARRRKSFTTIESFIATIESSIRGNRNRYLSQVFQALRIEVNDEITALKDFLAQTKDVLKKGGRLVIITYHSLEDRLVKNFMRYGNPEEEDERDFFGNTEKIFSVITKKPIAASLEEIKKNPRARSAKLRIAERI